MREWTLQQLRYRWWSFFHRRCLVGFPWFWPARPAGLPAMVAARRLVRRQFAREHGPVRRTLAWLFTAVVWPPAVLVNLWEIRRDRGAEPMPMGRVPGAIWAALRHNVIPGEYYAYELWKPDRKVNIDNYLYAKEGPRLFKLLNRPSEPNPIDDKLAFHEMCSAHALPNPDILAAFTPTGTLLAFESGQPPARDLFVKPRFGLGSDGAEHLRWHGAGFESNRGCCLSADDLEGYLATRARTEKRTLLVQPALTNHPALRVAPHSSLAAARLITGLATNGSVFPICSFFYFAQSDNTIAARYVRAATIDMASGRLLSGPQEPGEPDASTDQRDENSNCPIALPGWEAAVRHVKIAHQACPGFAFVGWDVAFTEGGPMLLEGNTNWCADEHQRLRGEPLGHTKFAEILAMRLTERR
jgi:Sugar-transfer associated ATP-grasp